MRLAKCGPPPETDEEVRQNLPPGLVPWFDRVRGGIKADRHRTRTEAFLQYVEEHPAEEAVIADGLAEQRLKQILRPILDFYETPAWAIHAVFPVLPVVEGVTRILDPGCGTGAILRELGAAFPENEVLGLEKDRARFEECARSTDLPVELGDFFHHHERYDLIVSNPPYAYALEFVQHALTLAPVVCMLLRLPWLAGQARAQWQRENPSQVNVLPRRPSFTGDGKTDATEYAWFAWGTEKAGTWQVLETAKHQRRRK